MKNYVTTRKEVCAGKLIGSCGLVCRGMLFNINDDGLANDLIYTTPTGYPIQNIEPKIEVESEFIIQNYVELEELLKYLNYGIDLTQNDLDQIFRKFITHNWWLKHHMELFGWRKFYRQNTGEFSAYVSGGTQVISKSIYHNLYNISIYRNGKPHKEEPCYSLIKKRK